MLGVCRNESRESTTELSQTKEKIKVIPTFEIDRYRQETEDGLKVTLKMI